MNGFASSRGLDGFDGRPQLLRPLGAPKGAALVEAYKQDTMNDLQRETPRYNPVNTGQTQSSPLVDLNDTVQVHLLTETALFESRDYEILSQEEADELKKQVRMINQMIQQTRSNLAVQSKYRDATISMSKLYSPTTARRSLLGNRASGGDSAREVEAEREAIQKKCEELASELWVLERRIMEPQRRLLEHTAGILQLTHKSAARNASTPKPRAPLVNGVPASPESMYTTSNGRNSMEPDDVLLFDESSWDDVAGAVGLDTVRSKPGTIEIPLKSPVREQQKLLAEESERLREENATLKQEADSLRARAQSLSQELESLKDQGTNQWQLISDTEKKLEAFNDQLRQVIISADPTKTDAFGTPPSGQLESGDLIGSQLDYLERAVRAVGDNQGNSRQAAETTQSLNRQVHELILQNGMSDYPMPPDAGADYDDQARYMQEALGALDGVLQNASSMAKAGSADRQKGEQSEAILMGLWEIIQSGYADIQQRNKDRRRTRMEQGGPADDEDDMSDTEAFDPNEAYSLSAFSTKVQWLYAESTKLKEQKAVLKRQIKQQRELNSKSDSEKDEALRSKESELEEARGALVRAEKQTDDARRELSDTLANLETVQNNIKENDETQSAASQKAVKEAEEQVSKRDAKIATLEASTHDMQKQLSLAEANISAITAQIRQANETRNQAEKAAEEKTREVVAMQQELADKQKELDNQQKELQEMTGMVTELKIEATLAKAELDGAYGTRRERAAEAAALTNMSETSKLQARVDVLQPRIDELENELKATVQDLKDITKQAIDAETKIAELEGELDQVSQAARKEKEQLQDALDQERLKLAVPLSPSGRPNASILTDTYRDALKAERKKYEEQLKNEQTNRRKVEEELKQLKKAAGPGKSLLSPR